MLAKKEASRPSALKTELSTSVLAKTTTSLAGVPNLVAPSATPFQGSFVPWEIAK